MSDERSAEAVYVDIQELSIGMFVILELSWLQHPFTFNSFVVRTEEQLATIRSLGLTKVRIDPRRGMTRPSAQPEAASPAGPAAGPVAARDETSATIAAAKSWRIEQNRILRASMGAAERKAAKAATVLRDITKSIYSEPQRVVTSAGALVDEVTSALLGNSEVMIHLLNDHAAGEEVYYHSLNVTMLALLLGKAIQFDAEMLRMAGVAAIFHDIGKEEIPYRVRSKTEPLTRAETDFLRQHCAMGARLATQAGLPEAVVGAILQHHENIDGSGYPAGLAGDAITPVSRLVGVVNAYDNLCNPVDPAKALTPHEALSMMFAKRKGWYDPAMLGKLIHVLGVYPPGSIVRLSTGATAMVVSMNPARPLLPMLLVHDPAIPKEEAVILELEKQPDISISKAIRPATLTREVYEYLSPRKRMTYYFDDKGRPS
ncbi:MAG TPA: HD domain-containing phosphohydrolase [Aromatoleum sp.]|uniref:HD-GYP domain-containing protein n=1 Tax=Aromatoleum sp. TaxID=2307007 RepID=UPI002B48314C|nr:HD domain-containing phosphohydrolase [Aromatoleum sp.]HJV25582.1 HD domain-containing phosphohydrolase [Aromatoleum sp.]